MVVGSVLSVLIFFSSAVGAKSDNKYQFLPEIVQQADFPIKESFRLMSQPGGLSKKARTKINRYLDLDPKKGKKDQRITPADKQNNPLIYIALAQLGKEPVQLAAEWGLKPDDPMVLFATGLKSLEDQISKMHEISLADFQEKIEKPLVMAILKAGHQQTSWEAYRDAEVFMRQKMLYRIEFSYLRDVDIASYGMYVLSASYMMMFRLDNNIEYGKKNFEVLSRIFDVVEELKAVYDPENPLLFYISKKIDMRF